MPIQGFNKANAVAQCYITHSQSRLHPYNVVVRTHLDHGPDTAVTSCKSGLEAINTYHRYCFLLFTPVNKLLPLLKQQALKMG